MYLDNLVKHITLFKCQGISTVVLIVDTVNKQTNITNRTVYANICVDTPGGGKG